MPSKVLLAGSDHMLQQMAGTFDAGQIHTASTDDGYEAVCLLNEITPDLLIAEIALPEKDGYALCRYVRQEPEFESLPVILLDRAFNVFNQRRAFSAGADLYLSQPLSRDELIEAVHRLLAGNRAQGDDLIGDEDALPLRAMTRPRRVASAAHDPLEPAAHERRDEQAAPPPLTAQRPSRLLFAAAVIAAALIAISLAVLLRTPQAAVPGQPAAFDKSSGALATTGQPFVTTSETEARPAAAGAASPSEAASSANAGSDINPDDPEASAADADDTAVRPDAPNDAQKVEDRQDEPTPVAAPAGRRADATAAGERRPSTPSARRAGRTTPRVNHWRRGGQEMVASGEHFGSGAKHFGKGSARAALWAGKKAGSGVKRMGLAIKRIF